MEAKKSSEAADLVSQAEKYLKTSFFKWKPDYELAADCYNKAATCYKTAKELAKSKECLYKAADCYKQMKSFFSAAKCLDQAILNLRDLQNWKEIPSTAHRACQLFQEHGSPDTAAMLLDKAAKMVEPTLPEEALTLYKRAMDVVMIEDRPRQASEYASRAGRLLVRLGKYEEAVNMLTKEMSYHTAGDNKPAMGRTLVAVVLLHLAREDVIAAGKVIEEWGGGSEQEEVIRLKKQQRFQPELLFQLTVAVRLHQAFDSNDPEEAERALADPFVRHMDVDYAKLTRSIPLPKGMEDLEQAGKNLASKLESLNVEDIPAIDDEDIENEYGGVCQGRSTEQSKVQTSHKDEEEDLEGGGLC